MDIPEEIKSRFHETHPEIVSYILNLLQIINSMDSKIKKLESRVNLNSRNSGKPPSSDGYERKNRQKRKEDNPTKKPGGQPGHKGKTLQQTPNPDYTEYHTPDYCPCCGGNLENGEIIGIEKRQVYDLPPPPTVEVTEHQNITVLCPHYKTKSSGIFPLDINQPVQYGPRIRSYVSYLVHYQLIPYERATELCSDLFGFSISPGTIVNLTHTLAQNLKPFEEDLVNKLRNEPVIHNDETGIRVEGKLHWLHVTCTPYLTYYLLHSKRGTEAIDAIGILPEYQGVSVHDFWKPYLSYPCQHSFCCAHIIRELIRSQEETAQKWPSEMIDLLVQAKKLKEIYHPDGENIPDNLLNALKRRYHELVQIGLEENPPPLIPSGKRGKTKKTFTRNLLERLNEWEKQVLRFLDDPLVPFDNNLAERDIRMVKVKMKISGGFRNFSTAQAVALIRSYISTVRKNNRDVIGEIVAAFNRIPWISGVYQGVSYLSSTAAQTVDA